LEQPVNAAAPGGHRTVRIIQVLVFTDFGPGSLERLPVAGGGFGIDDIERRQVTLRQVFIAVIHTGYRLREGAILTVAGDEGKPIFIDRRKRFIQYMDNIILSK
jgi:UDP-N-acetylglucosamine transferase subunit ALG13